MVVPLVSLHPQKGSNLLRIRKSLRFDRRVWQEDADYKSNHHGHCTDSNVKDPPTRELPVRETNAVCYQSAKDLRQRVAYVEPRHPAALLFFLVPHSDNQDQDGCNAVGHKHLLLFKQQGFQEGSLPAFKDPKQRPHNRKSSKTRAGAMKAKYKTPDHDIHPQVSPNAREMLRQILSWKLRHQKTCSTQQ